MADLVAGVRVTAEEVEDIIDTDLTEGQIHAMINTAHGLVEAKLAGKGLSATTLTSIELWLSAHYVAIRDPRERNKSTGNTSVGFEGRFHFGTGLGSTSYGQQALALDTSGTLASLGSKRASFSVD